MYVQGRELKPGQRANCLSSVEGIVTDSPEYIVTNEVDKKGNPKLVNVDTGSIVVASPLSVWNAWNDAVMNTATAAPRPY